MVRELVSGNADLFVGLDKRTIANTVHIRRFLFVRAPHTRMIGCALGLIAVLDRWRIHHLYSQPWHNCATT